MNGDVRKIMIMKLKFITPDNPTPIEKEYTTTPKVGEVVRIQNHDWHTVEHVIHDLTDGSTTLLCGRGTGNPILSQTTS